MKKLITIRKILEPIIISKFLIRSLNPETYTFYCVYSEEKVSNNDYLLEENGGYINHIIACGKSNSARLLLTVSR